MVQLTSWQGRLTKAYETSLGLSGGYVRKVYRDRPASMANSEYVKSTDDALIVVARSGSRVNPTRTRITAHYNNIYGADISARQQYEKRIKKLYQKRLRELRR